jgi:DtxR family transcriptional regulator, Mn-dependent transcriptional regulator
MNDFSRSMDAVRAFPRNLPVAARTSLAAESGWEHAAGRSLGLVGAAVQDYLKVIYKLTHSDLQCSPSLVAERMGVSPAAVTKMVKRLQDLKLVRYERSQDLSLTPAGEKIALEIIRHHRLLETYLKELLGYSWDEVDSEAEKLEHVISEEFEDRIDALLGFPTHDPHGDPIPTKEGHVVHEQHRTLNDLEPGEEAVVRRVTDGDPQMLRYLGQLGLYPHTPVHMLGREPYGGSLHVRVGDREQSVGPQLAEQVFVSAPEEAQ